MNDPLKDFVNKNREAFDNLEPPTGMSDRILQQLKKDKEPKKTAVIYRIKQWGIAASVLLVFGLGTILYFSNDETTPTPIAKNKVKESIQKIEQQSIENQKNIDKVDNIPVLVNHQTNRQKSVIEKAESSELNKEKSHLDTSLNESKSLAQNEKQEIIQLMNNSESASSRINGILKAGQQTDLDHEIIDLLASSASEDSNSNVRLAAVELLATQAKKPYVAEKIVDTFIKQNDPVVQVELINLLAKMDNSIKIEEVQQKLLALAQDPTTLAYVKDEAYVAMMYY